MVMVLYVFQLVDPSPTELSVDVVVEAEQELLQCPRVCVARN